MNLADRLHRVAIGLINLGTKKTKNSRRWKLPDRLLRLSNVALVGAAAMAGGGTTIAAETIILTSPTMSRGMMRRARQAATLLLPKHWKARPNRANKSSRSPKLAKDSSRSPAKALVFSVTPNAILFRPRRIFLLRRKSFVASPCAMACGFMAKRVAAIAARN